MEDNIETQVNPVADPKPEMNPSEKMKEWIKEEYPFSFQPITSGKGEEILEIRILDMDTNDEQQQNGIFSKESGYDNITKLAKKSSRGFKPYIQSMLSKEGGLYVSDQGITTLERCCEHMRKLIEDKGIPSHYLDGYTLRNYTELSDRDKKIFKEVLGYVNSRNEKAIKEGKVLGVSE